MEQQPKETQKEIEIQLSELEERVDRLRALYEQYFLGYEKLEPTVPRKDVDRRFANLRKMQLRNTALRFRFNVITQKFNTYAMYWTRVCRQIEEGTYKRHLVKANKRFGGDAVTANRPPGKRDDESSIDVDLGDFEDDLDMEQVLADANAAAESYGSSAHDTLPPSARAQPALSQPTTEPIAFRPAALPGSGPTLRPRAGTEPLKPLVREIAPSSQGMAAAAPPSSTAFAARGGRETVGPESRPMRAAALPPGAKPRVLVRKGDGMPESTRELTAPPSARESMAPSVRAPDAAPSSVREPTQPMARPRLPSMPASERAPVVRPRAASLPDSERTPVPSAVPSAGRIAVPPPSTGQIPPSTSAIRSAPYRPVQRPATMPESTRHIVARPPTPSRAPENDRPSIGRIATPASPMTPRPVPSSNRMPVAPLRGDDPAGGTMRSARPTTGIVEREPAAPAPTRRPPPPLPSASKKT